MIMMKENTTFGIKTRSIILILIKFTKYIKMHVKFKTLVQFF